MAHTVLHIYRSTMLTIKRGKGLEVDTNRVHESNRWKISRKMR